MAILPPAIDLTVIQDTTASIRNSVRDVEITLVLSTILVVLVVFLFLRNLARHLGAGACRCRWRCSARSACMYLLGFSLDNFSLMALIISTGFVVDNTIVVLENVTRHRELGESRLEAALKGAQEVAFTVISMSVSLVAVFLPILLLGGIIGRLFHEFAVTLTIGDLHVADRLAHRHADDVRLSRFQRRRGRELADAHGARAHVRQAAWIFIAARWPGRWTIPRPSCSPCWWR